MKWFVTSGALLASVIMSSAMADDSRVKNPRAVAAFPTWTGFYIGLNAGGVLSNNTVTLPPSTNLPGAGFPVTQALGQTPSSVNINNDRVFGGVQAGFNWQVNQSLVLGVEADFQGASAGQKTSMTVVNSGGAVFTTQVSRGLGNFGTLRGRAGYLVSPMLLVYGTGGLAIGRYSLETHFTEVAGLSDAADSSVSGVRTGWTAGAGSEWKMTTNWSAKLEYLYSDFGHVTAPTAIAVGPLVPVGLVTGYQPTWDFRTHVIRAGVNYSF